MTNKRFHAVMNPRSEMQRQAREFFEAEMKRLLAKKPWIADYCERSYLFLCPHTEHKTTVIPDFAVGCRRLTPGPGYLEALCEDNVCTMASNDHHRIVTARSGRLRARRNQACNGGGN